MPWSAKSIKTENSRVRGDDVHVVMHLGRLQAKVGVW